VKSATSHSTQQPVITATDIPSDFDVQLPKNDNQSTFDKVGAYNEGGNSSLETKSTGKIFSLSRNFVSTSSQIHTCSGGLQTKGFDETDATEHERLSQKRNNTNSTGGLNVCKLKDRIYYCCIIGDSS